MTSTKTEIAEELLREAFASFAWPDWTYEAAMADKARSRIVASRAAYLHSERTRAELLLTAAAPDLLKALQAIVSEVIGPEKPYSADSYLPRHLIYRARQAIAKAIGASITELDSDFYREKS